MAFESGAKSSSSLKRKAVGADRQKKIALEFVHKPKSHPTVAKLRKATEHFHDCLKGRLEAFHQTAALTTIYPPRGMS
jgi:hypothetical protein